MIFLLYYILPTILKSLTQKVNNEKPTKVNLTRIEMNHLCSVANVVRVHVHHRVFFLHKHFVSTNYLSFSGSFFLLFSSFFYCTDNDTDQKPDIIIKRIMDYNQTDDDEDDVGFSNLLAVLSALKFEVAATV